MNANALVGTPEANEDRGNFGTELTKEVLSGVPVSQTGVKNKEERILEFGNMSIPIGDSFEEKKAADYVEEHSMDGAIERLARLSLKSDKAKRILRIVLNWKYWVEPKKEIPIKKEKAPSKHIHNAPVTKQILEPKQKYLNMLSQLDLSCDIVADSEWHPVVDVDWVKAKATINEKRVIVSKEHITFMRKNVFNRGKVSFKMHLIAVSNDKVIAEPDVDDFNACQYRHKQAKKFESNVRMDDNAARLVFDSPPSGKKVIIPKRHLNEVKEQLGIWQFVIIHESEKNLVVKPIKCVKEAEPTLFEARVYKGKYGPRVFSKEIGKKLIVPERYRQGIGDQFGIWKFVVIADYIDCVVARPVCFLHTEIREQAEHSLNAVSDQWLKRNTEDRQKDIVHKEFIQPGLPPLEVVDKRADKMFSTLMSNGKISL